MTEGNQTLGSSKRLKWIKPTQFNSDATMGGVALIDDLTRDKNLRGVSFYPWVDTVPNPDVPHQTMWFAPVADGIINGNLSDHDDRPYISGALRAALSLDDCTAQNGCSFPAGRLPASLP